MFLIKYLFYMSFSCLSFCKIAYAQDLNHSKVNLSLNLQTAMDIAEKNSSDVKLTNNELQNFNTQHKLSFFKLGPSVTASGDTNWFPNQNSTYNTTTPERNATASINVEQPITGIWQNAYQTSALSAQTEAASHDLSSAKIKARSDGAQAFIAAQQAFNDLEIKKTEYEFAALQYKETNILFETGDETKDKIDLLLSQANATKTEIEYENTKNLFQNKIAELKKVLNLNDEILIQLKSEETSNWEKQKNEVPDLNTLLIQSKKNRNEIKSLEQKIKASNSTIAYNNFEYLPKASFISSYSNSESFGNNSFLGYTDVSLGYSNASGNTLSVGIKLSWTIWDGGLSLANRMNSVTELEKNKINKDKKVIDISNEVTTAYNNLKLSILILPQSKLAEKIYEEAYKLSKIKYKTGNLKASDLIKTQNDYTNSRMNLSKLRGDIDNNWIQLQAAIGKNPISSTKR